MIGSSYIGAIDRAMSTCIPGTIKIRVDAHLRDNLPFDPQRPTSYDAMTDSFVEHIKIDVTVVARVTCAVCDMLFEFLPMINARFLPSMMYAPADMSYSKHIAEITKTVRDCAVAHIIVGNDRSQEELIDAIRYLGLSSEDELIFWSKFEQINRT